MDGMLGDASQHIGKPSLGIDVVQPRGLNQGVHHSRPLAVAIRTGEQPRLAAKGNTAQLSLRRIIAEANPPVVEEAREGGPALELYVVRTFRTVGLAI